MAAMKGAEKLQGVHPHLLAVIVRAADTAPMDIIVLEGVRTLERQRQLVAKGASTTLRSRHIPGPNGYSHAVDVAPVDSKGNASWDWDLYFKLSPVIKQATRDLGYPIEWGGDWRTFKDGPHWQLPWASYPGTTVPDDEPDPVQAIPEEDDKGRPTLRKGAFGPDVKILQTSLNARGYGLKVDGGFGPKTVGAVVAFQKAAGLVPDGVVGPKTWAALV